MRPHPSYRGASNLELENYNNVKEDLFRALKLNKNEDIIYDFIYTYYSKIQDYRLALTYFEKINQFPEAINERYYANGMGIYLKIITHKQETDPEKIKQYSKLVFEYGNKAYRLNPSAKNKLNLCLAEMYLNHENVPNKICYEARDQAKQEKNDDLYKKINDLLNAPTN